MGIDRYYNEQKEKDPLNGRKPLNKFGVKTDGRAAHDHVFFDENMNKELENQHDKYMKNHERRKKRDAIVGKATPTHISLSVAKQVLLAYSLLSKDGHSFVSQKAVSKHIGRSETTVKKAVKFLRIHGFIETIHRYTEKDGHKRRTTSHTVLKFFLKHINKLIQIAMRKLNDVNIKDLYLVKTAKKIADKAKSTFSSSVQEKFDIDTGEIYGIS